MIAYVNGAKVPEGEACVSIFDRGFLFGDGVYEITPVVGGRLIDRDLHMARLARSMGELRIEAPLPLAEIDRLQEELVADNGINEGRVYMQVTRGAAERDFPFPAETEPTLVIFCREVAVLDVRSARTGIRVMTVEDIRWARRDIKTVMLLPAVLAKQVALDKGFDDAWFVQDGFVTEGSSNNAYIIKEGTIFTRPLSNDILPGCTRHSLFKLAEEADLSIVERPFTPQEACEADEAFVTSATMFATGVVGVDGITIGDGKPGPLTTRLRSLFIEYATNGG